MSRTRNATQILTVASLAALFAVPVASATTTREVVHASTGSNRQAIRALELRGQGLDRLYHLGAYAITKQVSVSEPQSFGTTAGGAPLAPGAQDVSGA